MEPNDLTDFLRRAEKQLEDALRHFEYAQSPPEQEFLALKLQACIFQYDICAEMAGLLRNNPTGFAASVALKGLILRLYEYDSLINNSQIPRLLNLANIRGIPHSQVELKKARLQWKSELDRLKRWKDVRNQAAGHYGRDLSQQISLLKELSLEEVMAVVRGFLCFNKSFLIGLRDAGRGVASDA